MADLDTLKQRLTDAEAALHTLMTTGQPVEVRVENDRITYQPNRTADLRDYILGLKTQIISAGGTPADGGMIRRPLRVYFGRGR